MLGSYTGSEYKIELLQGAQANRIKPLLVPPNTQKIIEPEVNRLIVIGV